MKRWIHAVGICWASAVVAAACSSGDQRHVAGASGEGGGAGERLAPPPEGGSNVAEGGSNVAEGGSDANPQAGGAPGGAGGQMQVNVAGAGEASSGEAGAGGAIHAGGAPSTDDNYGVPVEVKATGCFIHSGDGGDLLSNGEIAVNVTAAVYSPACDAQWVSSNAGGYAPEATPTTISMRRAFVVDTKLAAGTFSITFKADDAVEFVLNGKSIGVCTPPADNNGYCQQVCTTSEIPAEALAPAGSVNQLEARLINTYSIPADGGNFGYTALNYSVCVSN